MDVGLRQLRAGSSFRSMNAVEKLRQLVGEIQHAGDGFKVADAWSLAGRLLSRQPGADPQAVQQAIKACDIDALDAIVTRIEHPELIEAEREPKAKTRDVSNDDMRKAMHAFRKRLRLGRLADESKLGGRNLTGGRLSSIDAIIPPQEFNWEVWDALVAAGRLEDAGKGFYALPEAERNKPLES